MKTFKRELKFLHDGSTAGALHPVMKAQIRQAVLANARVEDMNYAPAAPRWYFSFSLKYTVMVIAGILFVSGTAYAAGNTKPGDLLFPFRKASERLQVTLAVSDTAKAELETKFAQERLQELNEIQVQQMQIKNSQQETHTQQAEVQATAEVNSAIGNLTQVQAKLQAKGNQQAAANVEATIQDLQAHLKQHGRNFGDKDYNSNENSGASAAITAPNTATSTVESEHSNRDQKKSAGVNLNLQIKNKTQISTSTNSSNDQKSWHENNETENNNTFRFDN